MIVKKFKLVPHSCYDHEHLLYFCDNCGRWIVGDTSYYRVRSSIDESRFADGKIYCFECIVKKAKNRESE